jgi:hypothetical protein
VSDKSELQNKSVANSSWSNFKMSSNGTSSDIRRSAAEIRTKVFEERKIFADSSIIDGGTKNLK